MKRRFTVIGGILLSIALLFYVLRDVSPGDLLEQLRDADILLLIAATVVATLTFHLRAIRWRILFSRSSGPLPFSSRYAAVCIGFMVNNVLPARLGEFARAYSLSRIEPVRLSSALGTLVVERMLDAIVLMALLVPAFFLSGFDAEASGVLRSAFTVAVSVVSLGLIMLGLLVRFPEPCARLMEKWSRRFVPDRWAGRLAGIVTAFAGGLDAFRSGHVLTRALMWSFAVWIWNGFSFYLGFLAFDIAEPGFRGALVLQTTISFAVAIPSTPGFFGWFEAAARVALELYRIEPARIVSFAAGYHILTFMPITVLGIWYMRRLGITREEFGRGGGRKLAARDSGARTEESG